MSNQRSEDQNSVLDSETSVDYYVTTVNDQTPTKAAKNGEKNGSEDTTPIVVSVDRAGSVKVRTRKKSKRRKKKSNLALEESGFHVSDEGALSNSSASDESHKKMPRRSSSLSEKDLRRTSFRVLPSEVSQNGTSPSAVVRRRSRRRTSLKSSRRQGIILDDIALNPSANFKITRPERKADVKQFSPRFDTRQNVDSSEPVAKKLNRQDALATLHALMIEVEEATTEAKQQEGERKKGGSDTSLRKSLSMSQLVDANEDVVSAQNDSVSGSTSKPFLPSVSIPTIISHQKSNSYDLQSPGSCSVFMSDPDASIDDPSYVDRHRLLGKTSSEGSRTDKSLSGNLALANQSSENSELNNRRSSERTRSVVFTVQDLSQSSLNKPKDFDYGLSHLEQVCKLFEQIGQLRKQNQALVKRVHDLESQVKILKQEKNVSQSQLLPDHSSSVSDSNSYTAMKRLHPVDRFKDAISRSTRKANFDKLTDPKRISQPLILGNISNHSESTLPSYAIAERSNDKRAISNLSFKRYKRRPYSRDDLDLASKGRWKFWKGQGRSIDQQPSKDPVVSSIKAENRQGAAVHLKSASVTIDTLLSNVDSDFSNKLAQWQSSMKSSGGESRKSDVGLEVGGREIRSRSTITLPPPLNDRKFSDEKYDQSFKDSFRKKLSKWEKRATQKFSGDRRSQSYDIVNGKENSSHGVKLRSSHNRSMSASADFHKSLPSIVTATTGLSHVKHFRGTSAHNSSSSVEWSGIQEAFPTTLHEGKPLQDVNKFRMASPVQRKKKSTAKRSSWSHSKFVGSFFLPNADFLSSNTSAAGSIGDQLTLQLDPHDVEGVGLSEADSETDQENQKKKPQQIKDEKEKDSNKGKPYPLSSLAKFHTERGALSFRRSSRVEILRLSSCEVLSSAPIMSPVLEEEASLSHSLPVLCKSKSTETLGQTDTENPRRYTVTVIDLKKPNKVPEMTQSDPCLTDQLPPLPRAPSSAIRRSISCRQISKPRKNKKIRRNWATSSLQKSRRTSASVSSDSLGEQQTPQIIEPEKEETIPKKSKSKTGKMFNRLQKISPKSRSSSFTMKVNGASTDNQPPSGASQLRKKTGKIFSFRSKSSASSPIGSTESSNNSRVRAHTENQLPEPVTKSSIPLPKRRGLPTIESKRKQASKVLEMSERFADDGSNSSHQAPEPAPISKGIVSRLSKRFTRHDKKKSDKKSQPNPASNQNANFLSAKSRFEMRANSESRKTSFRTKESVAKDNNSS